MRISAARSYARVLIGAVLLVGVVVPAPATAARRSTAASASKAGDAPHVEGELLVGFATGLSERERSELRRRHGLVKLESLPLPGVERVRTTRPGSAPSHSRALRSDPRIRHAEPNYLWAKAALPNDPEIGQLWGLNNTAQRGGVADADIDAPEGWDLAADSSSVIVAVLDEGIDTNHPDLASNVWVNPDEVPGDNVDNDGNGYVDDTHGWDWHNNDSTVFDHNATGTATDAHGTHVAGTIAAVADNNLGIAGVSQSKLMSLKFLGPAGGSSSNAVKAIDYAIREGADIINASIGGFGYSEFFAQGIARAAGAGILFTAAAGNGGDDSKGDDNDTLPHYPSGFEIPEVIAVAATNSSDALGTFSNFGATSVDLGAPGVDIVSTVPRYGRAVSSGSTTLLSFDLAWVDPDDRTLLMQSALQAAGVSTTDNVMVVQDDGDAASDWGWTYRNRVQLAGYTALPEGAHDTGDGCLDGPDLATMRGYDAIVWFTFNRTSCTLSVTDQARLTTYLDEGGKLVLFGHDIAQDIDGSAFLATVLKTDLIASGAEGTDVIEGMPATTFDGMSFSLGYLTTPDAIAPLSAGTLGLESRGATYNGTSMATPHVAGAAAQVMAKFPNMKAKDVKTRLMATGDSKASLNGTTASGKRLNLANALATGTIAGTVTGTGGALGGVCVTAWSSPGGSYFQSTSTSPAGEYSLSVPTGAYTVQFRPCSRATENYAAEWYTTSGGATNWSDAEAVSALVGTSTVNVTLEVGTTISGRVTSEATGDALTGICVTAFTAAETFVAGARTAPDGTYTLRGFVPGSYQVVFRDCEGDVEYATEWWNGSFDNAVPAQTLVVVGANAVTGIDASLVPTGRISGWVTETVGPDLYWLPGMCVTAYTAGGAFIARTRSEAEPYVLEGVGSGVYKVVFEDCSGTGYTTEWFDGASSFNDGTAVSVTAGQTTAGIHGDLEHP